jgi:DNA-directed RNA polymerase specialized sigma24 family protein
MFENTKPAADATTDGRNGDVPRQRVLTCGDWLGLLDQGNDHVWEELRLLASAEAPELLRRAGSCRSEADDLVAELVLDVWRTQAEAVRAMQPGLSLRTWIRDTLECRAHGVAQRRRQEREVLGTAARAVAGPDRAEHHGAEEVGGVRTERELLRARLRRMIRRLTSRQREAIRFQLEGVEIRSAAARMGIDVKTYGRLVGSAWLQLTMPERASAGDRPNTTATRQRRRRPAGARALGRISPSAGRERQQHVARPVRLVVSE